MLEGLLTEARHPLSANIDDLPALDVLRVMNAADAEIASAIEKQLPQIADAVERIAERLGEGGRLFYLGAGTSGRLGVLDASECPPTFHTPPEMVQGLIAGGDRALRNAVEGAEDREEAGQADLVGRNLLPKDAVVGIAASGRTPYVLGGLRYARGIGALTVALSCTPEPAIAREAAIVITPLPGPEIVTGSTRLRAGTATKMVLNMLSTATMIRLGYVYGNLMVNVQPTNEKLRDRAERIIGEISGIGRVEAAALLDEGGSIRTAVVMHALGFSRAQAEEQLARTSGRLRPVLEKSIHG